MTYPFHVRHWGRVDYYTTWQAMQNFTQERTVETADEVWLVEHHPVYTLGQNGKISDILQQGNIPIIQTDRGGQVTYHGPGQLIVYVLLNLPRLQCNIRTLITALENTTINLLSHYGIKAYAKREAPGVYVDKAKIASVGLRIRRYCCYHGLALNVDMDLMPFNAINPCGFPDLAITQLSEQGGPSDLAIVGKRFLTYWSEQPFYKTHLSSTLEKI